MTYKTSRLAAERHEECSQGRDPLSKMGNMVITGSVFGGVLSIWMFIFVWGDLPVVRPFLVCALIVGAVFGFALWLKHSTL